MTMPAPEREDKLAQELAEALPRALPEFIARQRWFGGKARTATSTRIVDLFTLPHGGRRTHLVLTRVSYAEGRDDVYAIPLQTAENRGAQPAGPGAAAPRLQIQSIAGDVTVCYDALWDGEFCHFLLASLHAGRAFHGTRGEIAATPTQMFRGAPDPSSSHPEASVMKGEQSNTSIRFGDQFIMKFYRRLEEGINPDLEIGAFLTSRALFKHTPPLAGALEYRPPREPPATLAILQAFVPNQGDAWRYTLGTLADYFERNAGPECAAPPAELPSEFIPESGTLNAPPQASQIIGSFWDSAGLLGRRTAELHLALSADRADPNFRPEPYSAAFQNSQYQSMTRLADQVFRTLEKRMSTLPASVQIGAARILGGEGELLNRFRAFAKSSLTGEIIRIHGDYHLGQVLFTGSDFVIIDFEGEPARPLEERRARRCPLQDVAGMLRSFHYAAYAALAEQDAKPAAGPREASLEAWAAYWLSWVSARFLTGYLEIASDASFLPRTRRELAILLQAHLLEKAVYELGYELNNRPDWVRLPLQGIHSLLETAK